MERARGGLEEEEKEEERGRRRRFECLLSLPLSPNQAELLLALLVSAMAGVGRYHSRRGAPRAERKKRGAERREKARPLKVEKRESRKSDDVVSFLIFARSPDDDDDGRASKEKKALDQNTRFLVFFPVLFTPRWSSTPRGRPSRTCCGASARRLR
jgi:hypothetical protein